MVIFLQINSMMFFIFNLVKYSFESCSYPCECTNDVCTGCVSADKYFSDGSCHDCIPPCLYCTGRTICQGCLGSYYLSGDSCLSCSKSCKSCQFSADKCLSCYDGYYKNNYKCEKCDSSCKTCKDSSTKCLNCANNYYYLNTISQKCLKCKEPCKTCSSEDVCISCIDDYFLNGGKCYKYNSNCKKSLNEKVCEICDDGYFLYNTNKQCLKCNEKCKTCKDSSNYCLTCNDKYYLSNSNTCLSCKSPCNTCINENKCKSCIDNYFYFSNLCHECAKNCETTYNNCKCLICQKGYYFDIYKCFKCNSNCKTCIVSSTRCTSCNNGYLLSNNKCIYNEELFNNFISIDIDDNNESEIEKKIKFYDQIFENIESVYTNEKYDTSILDNGEDDYLEINEIKMVLTTANNQKNNKYYNISSIDLRQCETLLKHFYHISEEESLYIKKIDIIQEDMKIPKIEYAIYFM